MALHPALHKVSMSLHKVSIQLLDMCGTKKNPAEVLFSTVDEVLSNVGVSLA